MNLRFLFVMLGLLFGLCRSAADTPSLPPAMNVVKSPDGAITVISDPDSRTTTVRRTATGECLWQMSGWYQWLFPANDGKHAVTGYDGMNLIPIEYNEKMALFTFWREGRKIREVTLEEFVPDKAILQRTVSHYYWGRIEKIDDQGRLVVYRADNKIFLFNLTTGTAHRGPASFVSREEAEQFAKQCFAGGVVEMLKAGKKKVMILYIHGSGVPLLAITAYIFSNKKWQLAGEFQPPSSVFYKAVVEDCKIVIVEEKTNKKWLFIDSGKMSGKQSEPTLIRD